VQTEIRPVVSMPKYLKTFRHEDWTPLVGEEPRNWGGNRLGTSWITFRARSMYMQARAEWRRQQRRVVTRGKAKKDIPLETLAIGSTTVAAPTRSRGRPAPPAG
jgi:hypothetical protein